MGLWQDLTGSPLAELLTPALNLALPFISSGISAGLSANQILSALQVGGLGVNRGSGLKLIKALRTPFGAPAWLRGAKADQYPGADLFRVAAYPTKSNYTYTYTIMGTNPLTGQEETQYVSISSNSLLESDAADAMAVAMGEGSTSGNALEDVQVNLESVKVSPDFKL